MEHVLLLCPSAQCVWFVSSLSYRVNPQAITLFDDWYNDIFNLVEKNKVLSAEYLTKIAFLCWEIWKARCNFLYSSSTLDPIKTALLADSAAFEYLLGINPTPLTIAKTIPPLLSHASNSDNCSNNYLPAFHHIPTPIISSNNPSSSHWSSHIPISNIHISSISSHQGTPNQ